MKAVVLVLDENDFDDPTVGATLDGLDSLDFSIKMDAVLSQVLHPRWRKLEVHSSAL
jgi:hypothetical protein